MTKKEEAVEHYDRMIETAKSYPPDEHPSISKMLDDIGESWSSNFCSYCQEVMNISKEAGDKLSIYDICEICELYAKRWDGIYRCCGGLWDNMDEADTWRDWIKRAGKVKKFIKENG